MSDTKSDSLQDMVERVPPLPAAASEALSEIGKSNSDTRKLSQILGQDPVLVGRILRVANSPFYGLPRQVSGLRDACVILGQHTLRNIISSAAAMEVFCGEDGQSDRLTGYWDHSSFVAGIAHHLAAKVGQDRESAFTAGILLNIGSIAIECLEPNVANQIALRVEQQQEDQLAVELEMLGYTHAHLAGEITQFWNLPEEVVQSVKLQYEPAQAQSAFCDLVHLSARIATGINLEHDADTIFASLGVGVAERLKFDAPLLAQWIEAMPTFEAA